MRYIVLILIFGGCSTPAGKAAIARCGKPSYDANAVPCLSPYEDCTPNDFELRCEAIHF